MSDRIKGYCSHCHNETYHIEQQWNSLRRNIYVCDGCKKPTIQCRRCNSFAKAGNLWDDEKCSKCSPKFSAFTILQAMAGDAVIKKDGYCSHCLQKTTHYKQRSNSIRRDVYVCNGCKKMTIPCRKCDENFAQGGDFWDDEECLECLECLEELKFDSKKFDNNDEYLFPESYSSLGFKIERKDCGNEKHVIFLDGFLTENDTNEESWKKQLRKIYPGASLYMVSWKSKDIQEITETLGKRFKSVIHAPGSVPVKLLLSSVATSEHIYSSWRDAKLLAEKMGLLLGNTIIDNLKQQEIILCGHSLGCRVIYHCLMQLHDLEKEGVIKEVHLLGGAVNANNAWEAVMSSVSGGVHNYFSTKDTTLATLYNFAEMATRSPIGRNMINVDGVFNYDVTGAVGGHKEYIRNFQNFFKTPKYLKS